MNTDSPTPLHQNDDDVRNAFRDLTSGLATPVTDIVTEATGRGRTLERRRTIVRVVAPLAVAAVVAPLALAASGSLSLPDLGSREGTVAGPSVTVLDPGTPVPEPTLEPATAPTTEPDPNGEAPPATPADNPAPTSTETDATSAAGGDATQTLRTLIEVNGGSALTFLTAPPTVQTPDDMPADLANRVMHGDADNRRAAVVVDDGQGASLVSAYVSAPEDGWSWEAFVAEDCSSASCQLTPQGALELSTDVTPTPGGDVIIRTARWVTPSGGDVLISSSNADGVESLGGKVTRPAPLLSDDQLTAISQSNAWWN